MFNKFFNKLLHEDEDLEDKGDKGNKPLTDRPQKVHGQTRRDYFLSVFVLFLGLSYRLYFIFFVSGSENAGVGWYGDTYHHWQIGYLTHTTGLKNGFLRLWDLKGMEYFWGPLHPLLLTFLFRLTGSFDIVITRFVSLVFGLGSIYLMYLIARRYWGRLVGFCVLVFGSLFPVAVFNDVSGSLEPIGVFFLLLGIFLWPKHAFVSGVAWALALMARAEAWLFSFFLILIIFLYKKRSNYKVEAFLGWFIILILYMKYLLDHTGNPIYPIWWNYLANARGVWARNQDLYLTELQFAVRPFLIAIAAVALFALVLAIYKRPRTLLFHIFGWGNIFFLGAFMGLGHYLKGWEWWFPVIRFFVFPYLFLATILFAFFAPVARRTKILGNGIIIIMAIMLVLVTQFTWIPIIRRFKETIPVWEQTLNWGKQIGLHYKGGTLLFPEHDPHFTYAVVKYGGVRGENILGQAFDPYFYFEGDPYKDWEEKRLVVLGWLKDYNVELAVVRYDAGRYQELFKRESQAFEKIDVLEEGVYEIWRVYPERITLDDRV